MTAPLISLADLRQRAEPARYPHRLTLKAAQVLALVAAVEAAQAVAQTHHYGVRATHGRNESVPSAKLERLRAALAPFVAEGTDA